MFRWKKAAKAYRNFEISGAADGTRVATKGMVEGTRIASSLGWRPVEALAVGDMILTFDNGMQPIIEVRRQTLWIDANVVPRSQWPVMVPRGALGNGRDLMLMADQGVVIESDVADEALDDPFAVLRASALSGLRGVRRVDPGMKVELVTLVFAEDQVVYAEGGVLIHCPPSITLISDMIAGKGPRYQELTGDLVDRAREEIVAGDAAAMRRVA